jgi:TonB family protein
MATPNPELTTSPVAGAAPTESDPVAQTLALLQPWIDYVPKRQRRLGLFIFLAFLLQISAFFFIRIDTTRAELRHQSHAHVTVENPQSAAIAGQEPGDVFWDRLTDPRLFLLPLPSRPNLTVDESVLDIDSSVGSRPLPPAATPGDFQFAHPVVTPLPQQVTEAMRPPRQPFAYRETPPSIAAKTTWRWEDALARRQPTGVPELPSPVSDTDLAPTELNVAVNPGGTVEHVFIEQSCGSGRLDLDQQAVQAARKIRFHSSDQPGLLWGRITVFWYYSPKPPEIVVPTPPSGP